MNQERIRKYLGMPENKTEMCKPLNRHADHELREAVILHDIKIGITFNFKIFVWETAFTRCNGGSRSYKQDFFFYHMIEF